MWLLTFLFRLFITVCCLIAYENVVNMLLVLSGPFLHNNSWGWGCVGFVYGLCCIATPLSSYPDVGLNIFLLSGSSPKCPIAS